MDSFKVSRNGVEYNAMVFNDIHNTCTELNSNNYKNWIPESITVIGKWYIAHGDYLIFDDSYNLVDVRSMNAFMKMYDIIDDSVPETYTIDVAELKEYILNLSTETTEFWTTEQKFIADEISNILRILNVPGYNDFNKFTSTLVD